MKYSYYPIFFIILFITSCVEQKINNKKVDLNCSTLQDCLIQINNVTYDKYGISNEAALLAKKFQTFGDDALSELIKLLESKNPTTLNVVGYAIAEFSFIDKKYFPAIKSGIEKDVSWLPRALGAIPTPEAAEYAVTAYLKSSTSPSNQEAFAVTKQGERAIPFIFTQTECNKSCEKNNLGLLIHIVGQMDESVKKSIADKIIDKLNSSSISTQNKRNLVSLLFKMGDAGKFIEDDLHKIAEKYPELGLAINSAYIGIKSKYSGQVFFSYLKSSPDFFMLRDIADIGPAARDAGPALVELLSNPDREMRLGAVRALGYIQYKEAVPALIPLMNEKHDIRLSWAATESLGMIAQPETADELLRVSQSHWYPAVKKSAKKAADRIKNGSLETIESDETNFLSGFFAYAYFDIESCKTVSLGMIPENENIKLNRSSKSKEKEKLTYDSFILSYGADDEEQQIKKDPNGIIEFNQYNMVEHREAIKQIPDVALKIEDGWLAGSDRGEWGGELVYLPNKGKMVKLLDDNIEDIYKFGDKYIAVTGLAHLTTNNGHIFQVHRQGQDWKVEPWISLPGAPSSSWLVETGELLINTEGGGSILVSPEGNLRMAPCE